MPHLQELLHKLEVGGGTRYLRRGLVVVAVVLLGVGYNWRAYRNMATQEAMDMAQLGRNIAQGKGYTTLFIRPFSIYLVKKRNQEKQVAPEAGKVAEKYAIKLVAYEGGQHLVGVMGGENNQKMTDLFLRAKFVQ